MKEQTWAGVKSGQVFLQEEQECALVVTIAQATLVPGGGELKCLLEETWVRVAHNAFFFSGQLITRSFVATSLPLAPMSGAGQGVVDVKVDSLLAPS